MNVKDFFIKCLEDNYNSLLISLEGLIQEELDWQPFPHCNSIGFLVWHYGRALDLWVGRLEIRPQIWERGWAEKFDRAPAHPDDVGRGFTIEQVQAFRTPEIDVLRGYAESCYMNMLRYLNELDNHDIERINTKTATGTTVNLATVLEQLVWELNQHGGQIAYIRGMKRGIEETNTSGPALSRNS